MVLKNREPKPPFILSNVFTVIYHFEGILISIRSSCPEVVCKKVVLKNFAKFLRTPFFIERLRQLLLFLYCWKVSSAIGAFKVVSKISLVQKYFHKSILLIAIKSFVKLFLLKASPIYFDQDQLLNLGYWSSLSWLFFFFYFTVIVWLYFRNVTRIIFIFINTPITLDVPKLIFFIVSLSWFLNLNLTKLNPKKLVPCYVC